MRSGGYVRNANDCGFFVVFGLDLHEIDAAAELSPVRRVGKRRGGLKGGPRRLRTLENAIALGLGRLLRLGRDLCAARGFALFPQHAR